MTDTLKAQTAKDVEDAVGWALAEGKTLEIAGQGSKRGLGRPSQSDFTLDLSALSGVTLYEPEELVLSARAGTPDCRDRKACGRKRPGARLRTARLRTDPRACRRARARSAGSWRRTCRGRAASRPAPRAIIFSAFTAVSGRGETFKSGGRVVKNVTGYDLCKLLAGSFGTLAAMTDVTIKTLPRSETEATVIVTGLDDDAVAAPMAAAMGSSCDVSGAAHLPAHVARRFEGLAFRARGDRVPPRRRQAVGQAPHATCSRALLKPFGAVEVIAEKQSRAIWRGIRDAAPFAATGDGHDRPLWRVSTQPGKGFELSEMISPGAQMFYDWGGGLIWILMPPADDAGASRTAASGRNARRTRDARARAGVDPRRDRCVPAAGRGGGGLDQAGQGQFRSQGHSQSRADVGGRVR